jgi:hypothetical protein
MTSKVQWTFVVRCEGETIIFGITFSSSFHHHRVAAAVSLFCAIVDGNAAAASATAPELSRFQITLD